MYCILLVEYALPDDCVIEGFELSFYVLIDQMFYKRLTFDLIWFWQCSLWSLFLSLFQYCLDTVHLSFSMLLYTLFVSSQQVMIGCPWLYISLNEKDWEWKCLYEILFDLIKCSTWNTGCKNCSDSWNLWQHLGGQPQYHQEQQKCH